jgi:hypothetical protein
VNAPHSDGGDANVNSPHAGDFSKVAGRDVVEAGGIVASDSAEVASAHDESSAATGRARSSTQAATAQRSTLDVAVAVVFGAIVVVAFVLLAAGVTAPGIVVLVIGGSGVAIAIYRLARGT